MLAQRFERRRASACSGPRSADSSRSPCRRRRSRPSTRACRSSRAQHLDEVRLHEDDRRELVVRAQLELRVVAARVAVVAAVRAAAIRIQRPLERHPLDRGSAPSGSGLPGIAPRRRGASPRSARRRRRLSPGRRSAGRSVWVCRDRGREVRFPLQAKQRRILPRIRVIMGGETEGTEAEGGEEALMVAVVAQLLADVLQADEQLGGAVHIRPRFHVRGRRTSERLRKRRLSVTKSVRRWFSRFSRSVSSSEIATQV